jgi:hypothetical protein
MHPPFVVMGLPRSRTAWLSKFLSYGGFFCGHEELRHMRTLDDVRAWLSQPLTGASETLAAPYWRLLAKLAPSARVVIVRRPIADVVESILRIPAGRALPFDRPHLTRAVQFLDAKLAQASVRLPGALCVSFADLENEGTCARIFEHCLPLPHDSDWWRGWAAINVQCDFNSLRRYAQAFAPQLAKLGEIAAYRMRADLACMPPVGNCGMTFQEETYADWRKAGLLPGQRNGPSLFDSHCAAIGEEPSFHLGKNWPLIEQCANEGRLQIVTARRDGQLFGYLMTILAPSMEEPGRNTAIHSIFFASPLAPGIGLKLQRFALAQLKARGIDEVFFRAAVREAVPKLGALFRRLGAKADGELYRLVFKGT